MSEADPPPPPGVLPMADKRRELNAYRSLHLDRDHKSRVGRRRVEAERLYRFIGNGTADQPYLKVTRADYLRVWQECAEAIKASAQGLGVEGESALRLQKESHERMVYERLAAEALRVTRSESAFETLHGRPMTPWERSLLGQQFQADGFEVNSGTETERRVRQMHIARVLGAVSRAAKSRPSLLQEAWASVVGPVIAAEVHLESVDPRKGVAICRCLNPGRAYDLRRRRALPGKLTDLLGLRIERIIFQ